MLCVVLSGQDNIYKSVVNLRIICIVTDLLYDWYSTRHFLRWNLQQLVGETVTSEQMRIIFKFSLRHWAGYQRSRRRNRHYDGTHHHLRGQTAAIYMTIIKKEACYAPAFTVHRLTPFASSSTREQERKRMKELTSPNHLINSSPRNLTEHSRDRQIPRSMYAAAAAVLAALGITANSLWNRGLYVLAETTSNYCDDLYHALVQVKLYQLARVKINGERACGNVLSSKFINSILSCPPDALSVVFCL